MHELGNKSVFYHKKLIPVLKNINPKTLITIGKFSKILTDYFKDTFICENYVDVEVLKKFESFVKDNDTILIKGSIPLVYLFCMHLKNFTEVVSKLFPEIFLNYVDFFSPLTCLDILLLEQVEL